jgi:hypothetical protein
VDALLYTLNTPQPIAAMQTRMLLQPPPQVYQTFLEETKTNKSALQQNTRTPLLYVLHAFPCCAKTHVGIDVGYLVLVFCCAKQAGAGAVTKRVWRFGKAPQGHVTQCGDNRTAAV